jgi:hypothetical protein
LAALLVAHRDEESTGRAERIGQALVGLTDGRLRDDLALLTLSI